MNQRKQLGSLYMYPCKTEIQLSVWGGGGSPDKQLKNSYILQNNSILLIILKFLGGQGPCSL